MFRRVMSVLEELDVRLMGGTVAPQTTGFPYVIRFLNPGAMPRMPFLTEAERDSFLESWAGVRENLGEPLPVEGTDYQLEGPAE